MMADREEVEALLATVRRLIGEGRYTFAPRRKSLEGIAELGISIAEAEEQLAKLNVNHYVGGPEADHSGSHAAVWIFGKSISRTTAYIKLLLEEYSDGEFVVCLSFHPTDREMSFPLRPTH